jgi:PLP dependent protein
VNWYFIGRVQTNKTRLIAENFHWCQTVDSVKAAERLSAQRPHHAGELQLLIQLQPFDAVDSGRGGCALHSLMSLAAHIATLPRLRLRGLMYMPLADLAPPALAADFQRARAAFEELQQSAPKVDTLSMGMSDDLEAAVAAGSTMVRVGTALFGPRPAATDPVHEP